ncbi:MAG: alkaline phosphatase family protein [Myxococcales bacterium]|nr:alkaline phosphatase family protein [Myxococcales bacterium]
MKRREALKRMGALGAAATLPRLLSGCGWNEAGSETTGITHLVVLCMENRSYDHYLGARALEGLGGDGLTPGMQNPTLSGGSAQIYKETVGRVPDPPHSWRQSRSQFNSGQNDGFVREYQRIVGSQIPPHVMGYFGREDLPFSWALADAYATSDRWFSSVLGPTWPNRMYLHSGQSGGITENVLPTNGGINWRSIHHQLNDAGVDWAYYFQDLPFVPLFKDLDTEGKIHRVVNDFFEDARDGNLAPVTWLEPNFDLNDDHPPRHPILGQLFMASVYQAMAQSPLWNNCMLVVMYDEHGGFFDHVPPPKAPDALASVGFDQLGFRVPAFIAGPYIKEGYVSSEVRDHCSVLSHITDLYGLSPLTERVAWAPNLLDFIDLERLEAGNPRAPTQMPEVLIDEAEIVSACDREKVSQPQLAALADAGFFAPEHDRRHLRSEDVGALVKIAKDLGAGRVRG